MLKPTFGVFLNQRERKREREGERERKHGIEEKREGKNRLGPMPVSPLAVRAELLAGRTQA